MDKIVADISRLIIDTSKLDHSFFAYETDHDLINTLEHNDLINDWHIERIRRLSSSARYLILSLQRLQVFGEYMEKLGELSKDFDSYYVLIENHRAACRDVCINIDIYVEHIKSFCRYYFFMEREKTDKTKEWRKALEQYKNLSEWIYIEKFIDSCSTMFKNEDTKFLIDLRNEEVHNVSPLELIQYKFQDAALAPVPNEYIISSQELHNKIVNVISLLLVVVSSLQDLLNNISPRAIYNYLAPQDGCLKNIIKMADRYKKEREYVKLFQ